MARTTILLHLADRDRVLARGQAGPALGIAAIGSFIAGCFATLVIAYFAVNAYTGNHGLRAQQDIDRQHAELTEELARMRGERAEWQRRVALLKSNSIDPDTLDERSRAVLNYLDPRDLTMMVKHP